MLAELRCDFFAAKPGHVNAHQGQVVEVEHVRDDGLAMIRKPDGCEGYIPTYFLEPAPDTENPGPSRRVTVIEPHKSSPPSDLEDSMVEHVEAGPCEVDDDEAGQVASTGHGAIDAAYGPLLPTNLPVVREPLDDIFVREGDDFELTARIWSRHEFGFRWFIANPGRMEAEITKPTTDGTVVLFVDRCRREDSGKYSLVVANDYGRTATRCQVHVIGPPSSPTDFRFAVDRAKPRAIRLRWSPSNDTGNSKLLWYTVQYTREGLVDYFDVIKGVRQTCIRISHLPGMVYRFRVFAFNEYFASEASADIVVDGSELDALIRQAHVSAIRKQLCVDLFQYSFAECFEVGKSIARGRTAECKIVECKINGRGYVGKFYNPEIDLEDVRREIAALQLVGQHPNLVHYFGTALTDSLQVVMLMDRAGGKPILQFICSCGFISEAIMQKYATDLLRALAHLHARGIAHLGVKSEDLQVESVDGCLHLVLVDLGSAEFFDGPDPMNASHLSVWQGGFVEYLAPEQLAHRPSCKSDIWAVGVLLFVLATGVSPFLDPDGSDDVSRRRVLEGEIADCGDRLRTLAPSFVDLISKIFVVDHRQRISASECLSHPWATEELPKTLSMVDYIEDYTDSRRDHLRNVFRSVT